MAYRAVALRSLLVSGVAALILSCSSSAHAQSLNITENLPGGVIVDPQGVLRQKAHSNDHSGALAAERVSAAKNLGRELTTFSKLRKVSLTRLEQVIRQHQGNVTEPMKYLAGLLRVHYVFYYPETKDIVLAGPAEGWAPDAAGRALGLTSGRPVLHLEDLVVALRAFPPGQRTNTTVTCSIDPTKEGLAAMQNYLRARGGYGTPGETDQIKDALRTSLGLQTISITGISPRTNMARVLVEADYGMKLISIGLEKPPVNIPSFVQSASPASISRNALFRFYFVPDYQCVRTSDDSLAMELVGEGVKLIGEDELISQGGERQQAGHQNRASFKFTQAFTKMYPQLAERAPVYAELRNEIDLCMATAFIQWQDYYGKAGWTMPFFGSEQSFAVETRNAPRQVESAVAAYWKGNRLTTPIGGGVKFSPANALAKENRLTDDKGTVAKTRQEIKLNLAQDQWWWD